MAIGADEDRVVARSGPALDASVDLGGDPVGLLRTCGKDLEANRGCRSGGPLRPEALDDRRSHLETIRVVESDQPIGRVEDRRERPVVASQDDGPCPDIALAEIEDVVDRGTAKCIDRLVVIADDGHVPVPLGECRNQLGLGAIRVLELVDEDVSEATGDRVSRGGRRPHEPKCERDLIPEIDAAVGRKQRLVHVIGTCELGLSPGILGRSIRDLTTCPVHARSRGEHGGFDRDAVRVCRVILGRDALVLATAEERRERGQEPGRIAERPVCVELELEQVLAQEDHDFGPCQHPQVGRQPELERVFADEPVAECMECGDRGVGISVRDELVHADRHLVCGLVGEGQCEDLGRLGPVRRDQPGDAARDDLGLAGPGARDHEQRPLAMRHRAQLVGVEATEQGIEARRVADHGRVHHRDEVAPRRARFAPPAGPGAHQVVGPGASRSRDRRRRLESHIDGGHVGSIASRRDS